MPLIELKSHFWSICICNFTISYWSVLPNVLTSICGKQKNIL